MRSAGSDTALAMPAPVLRTAQVVREVLLEAFPDRPLLEQQCKRAAMLLDIALREQGFRTSLAADYVVGPGDIPRRENGHVWVVVRLGRQPYLLDVTLTQFQAALGRPVP